MKSFVLVLFLMLFSLFFTAIAKDTPVNVTEKQLAEIAKKYGKKAEKRIRLWDKVIEKSKKQDILHKLKNINDFFNRVRYMKDSVVWKKKDYWASPFEFLSVGAGDCEDYAIAKYFSLRKLGVSDKKLRITYVKLLRRGTKYEEAHMVLTYYHKPNSTPIVLDNVNKKLQLASKRKDLRPVYSFNASGLWQAQNKGKTSKRVGKNNLKNWKLLMGKI